MSCQKVLSMLSAYIDGEVQSSDAEMIKAHLSECDSCAAEWKALQAMTGMLRTTPEAEPPAFLLAQIEAATVNRTGFLTRIQRAFDYVPTMVRWASAPIAAAIVLLGILLSINGDMKTPVAVKSPTERIQRAIPGMPGLPNITVQEQIASGGKVVATRPGSKAVWKVRTSKPGAKVANGRRAPSSRELKSEDKAEPVEEPKLEQPVVDDTGVDENTASEPEPVVMAEVQPEESASVVKVSNERPSKRTPVLDEPGAMDQLRARLASKSKGKLNSQEDRLAGRKYSVGLISLRF